MDSKSELAWNLACASVLSQPEMFNISLCGRVGIGGWLSEQRTDQELKHVLVLGVRTPSRANVSLLLLHSLEEDFDLLLPVLNTPLNGKYESFCDRHFEK